MRPLILSLASGLLLALSFPRFGHPAVSWIALAPLLVALAEAARTRGGLRRAWALGLAAGVLYFGGTLYWTSGVMSQYGGINPALVDMARANVEFPPFPEYTVNTGPVHTAFFFTSPGSVYWATRCSWPRSTR